MVFPFSTLKKCFFALPLLTVLVLASCGGAAARFQPPLVLAVNLSPAPVEVILSEDDRPVFQVKALPSFEIRPLMPVPSSSGVTLKVRPENGDRVTAWTDSAGTPYSLRLEAGNVYAVVVDPQGAVAAYSVPQEYSTLPKITVINATSDSLAQVQLASDFNKNVKVYIQELASNQITELYSFQPKTLSIYWQTSEQNQTGDYFRIENSDNSVFRQNFQDGHFYCILTANGLPGSTVHGRLWDITPVKP